MKSTDPRSALAALVGCAAARLGADPEQVPPPRQKWSFAGPFGHFDHAQLQRGFKVYREVCSICHGMKLVSFRNLGEPGGLGLQRGAGRADRLRIQDPGPRRQGRDDRACRPAGRSFPVAVPERKRGARRRYNVVPPDMSMLAKARTYERGFPWFIFDIFTQYQEQGPDYIAAMLTGYKAAAARTSSCRPAGTTTSISPATTSPCRRR